MDLDNNLIDLHGSGTGLGPGQGTGLGLGPGQGTGLGPGLGQGQGTGQAIFKDKLSDRESYLHTLATTIGGLQRLVDLKLKDNRGGGDMPKDLVEAVVRLCPGLRNGWTASAIANNSSNNNDNNRGTP